VDSGSLFDKSSNSSAMVDARVGARRRFYSGDFSIELLWV
jgi:hypothetical protein